MWFNFNKVNTLIKDFYLYKNCLRIYIDKKGDLPLKDLENFIIRYESKIESIYIYNPSFIKHKLKFDKPTKEAPIIF